MANRRGFVVELRVPRRYWGCQGNRENWSWGCQHDNGRPGRVTKSDGFFWWSYLF